MVRIYTRTGDDGDTSLYGGQRVRKDDVRVAACGTIDELNAVLGVVRAAAAGMPNLATDVDSFLSELQHRLFNLGAELATPQPQLGAADQIEDADVAALEAAIDRWEKELTPLKEFILPGGCAAAAQAHLARCVCRRAERLIVRLAAAESIRSELCRYVNRLSDALFVLARTLNHASGVSDTTWQRRP